MGFDVGRYTIKRVVYYRRKTCDESFYENLMKTKVIEQLIQRVISGELSSEEAVVELKRLVTLSALKQLIMQSVAARFLNVSLNTLKTFAKDDLQDIMASQKNRAMEKRLKRSSAKCESV